MKNILLLLLVGLTSVNAQTGQVNFSARIDNPNSETITILGPKKFKKEIAGKDGMFRDSFSVETGLHQLGDGTEVTMLYLKNGYDLKMSMDAEHFDESIVFTGEGAKENNFLAQKALVDERFEESFVTLADQEVFEAAMQNRSKTLANMLADDGISAEFKELVNKMMAMEVKQFEMMFKQSQVVNQLTGKESPSFNYENHKGGTTKLEDLRGNYVYIDTWATWCGPCLREIPAMKEVEQKYRGKKITFVGISIDKKEDHTKWREMVTSKNLGGVQLFADSDWNSQFIKDFSITGIPRFILIDPQGNVVDANAPRPSEPALQILLDKLL